MLRPGLGPVRTSHRSQRCNSNGSARRNPLSSTNVETRYQKPGIDRLDLTPLRHESDPSKTVSEQDQHDLGGARRNAEMLSVFDSSTTPLPHLGHNPAPGSGSSRRPSQLRMFQDLSIDLTPISGRMFPAHAFPTHPNVPKNGKYVPNPKTAPHPNSPNTVLYRPDVGGAGGIAGAKPPAGRA
jgi:hypothetical protein